MLIFGIGKTAGGKMNKINIILDCSGSMAEWSKMDIVVYLLNTIRSCKEMSRFSDIQFMCYAWAETIIEIGELTTEIDTIHEIEKKLSCEGSLNVKALLHFFESEGRVFLVLSDGKFHLTRKEISGLNQNLKPSTQIGIVSLGADAGKMSWTETVHVAKSYDAFEVIQMMRKLDV